LRAKRVHGLGPGQGPRQPVQADRGHAAGGQGRGQRWVGQRVEHAEDGLARPQLTDQLPGWLADGHDQVGAGQQLRAADHAGPGLGVGAVREPRGRPGTRLDQDVEAGAAQPRDHLRDERHPSLAGRVLLDDGYFHRHDLTMSTVGRLAASSACDWAGRGHRPAARGTLGHDRTRPPSLTPAPPARNLYAQTSQLTSWFRPARSGQLARRSAAVIRSPAVTTALACSRPGDRVSRSIGPDTDTAAMIFPPGPRTGADTEATPASRSATLAAQPRLRTWARAAAVNLAPRSPRCSRSGSSQASR